MSLHSSRRRARKRCCSIGHDWGALIAWQYAMFGRLPISKLIIMNVPHPKLAEKGLRTRRQLAKSWYIFFFQLPWIPEWLLARNHCAAIGRAFRGMAVDKSRFPDEVLRVYQDAAAEPGALTAMVNYYRALLRNLRRTRHRGTPRIETPTLMIWGEEDSALGKELSFGTEEYVRDLTLRYLPKVSHWVQQEAPETVNEMIEAWLLGRSVPYARGAQPAGAATTRRRLNEAQQILRPDGQAADALAGSRKYCIADRRGHQGNGRLPDAAGRFAAFHEMHLDLGHLIAAQQPVIIEIGLLNPAGGNRHLTPQRRR